MKMDKQRWQQIETLYHAALERTPDERSAFLADACADDSGLLREVEELLRHDGAAGSFMQDNALAVAAQALEPNELNQTDPQLFPGQGIGAYKILALLGRGGMGVVYRARDERLRREVAIKVLPPSFAHDADRLRRFEQEAHATSSLNHPNILTIYDIGAHEGAPFIVAELLEGEELRAQLESGALPARRALEYAQQITQGLAAAHEKGITHRDLKPENLFVTKDGRVKILDFGLAKLRPTRPGVVDTDALTQKRLTDPGVVMGTVGYMSPEQVRGQETDHRSDIFAFGVILFEMLSGQRPFRGTSAIEVMNAILKDEPPELSETKPKTSPQLEKLVRRCLEKRPERRFQTASDLGFALEASAASSGLSEISGGGVATSAGAPAYSGWRERGWMIAAGALALIALALGLAYFNRASSDVGAVRLAFVPPENLAFDNGLDDFVIVSPDGQKLAFTGRSADGKRQLWVRPIGATEAQALPDTEDAQNPFWSPDSRSIGFGARGKLKRIELAGGRPQTLCDATRFNGGSWSRDGVILFAPQQNIGLFQIPATGGEPRPVTSPGPAQGEGVHAYPRFLPDGRHFLYRVIGALVEQKIFVGSLDSKEVKQVLTNAAPAVYAPPGWLLFVRDGALVAQAFDADRLELKGEAFLLTQPTNTANVFGVPFSVSDNGVLIWQGDRQRKYQLVWFDRGGKQVGTVGAAMKVVSGQAPRLAPDGKRVAIQRRDPQLTNSDIWVIDLQRNLPTRLTSHPGPDILPIWSPDGSRIVFQTDRTRGPHLYQKAASGVGDEELLLKGASAPTDWSLDGRFILYSPIIDRTRQEVWALPLPVGPPPYQLLNAPFDVRQAQISPDGHWLAYVSDESGSYEIYVQPFTAEGKLGGDKKRISISGGSHPRFRRDGQELFYVATDGQMMAVKINTGTFETPKALFKTRLLTGIIQTGIEYDVTADGQRFLIGTQVGEPTPVSVILNWMAGLKK
jgi:eukaryotic-like serine/threonine-protein kinase